MDSSADKSGCDGGVVRESTQPERCPDLGWGDDDELEPGPAEADVGEGTVAVAAIRRSGPWIDGRYGGTVRRFWP